MIDEWIFGTTEEGKEVRAFTLTNGNGMEVNVLSWGATLWRVLVPDYQGDLRDVVLYQENLADIKADTTFMGGCIGPHGNRIGGASFELNGKSYPLDVNNNENNLHSGSACFFGKLWEAEPGEDAVLFRLQAPDGEGGFPGNRSVEVIYRLTEDNTVEIEYRGTSDSDTLMNMTNHAYFNLGNMDDHVLQTKLWIDADAVTEVDAGLIPTGKLLPVENTVFDFREAKMIGRDAFRFEDEQLSYGGGYDHNFVLNGSGYRKVASAFLAESGIGMEVFTDQPGLQFYCGNFLEAPYGKNRGFAMETQHFPDSVHHENFPSVVLRQGEEYYTKTGYRFTVDVPEKK